MKKKHPEHVNLERWLVSYADFITLLFAFFVVMYAISQADIEKFKKVAEGMRAAFSGGVGQGGGTTINQFENLQPQGGRIMDLPAGKFHTAAEADPAVVGIKEKLEESVSLEAGVSDVSDKLRFEFDPRGLVVSLSLNELYAPGEVSLNPDLLPLLDRVGRILIKSGKAFRVEGYADPGEIGKHDPWEFSAARAAWLVKHWAERLGLDPKQVAVAGYGTAHVIADPSKRPGLNRRIEIVIAGGSTGGGAAESPAAPTGHP